MTRSWLASRRAVLAAGAAFALPEPARAGTAAELQLLVGAAGGSSNDLEARAFAPFLERHLPRAAVRVVNIPGQAGLAAYQALSAAAADGATLCWAATPSLPARTVDGFTPDLMNHITLLGALQREPIALVAPPGTPADFAEFRRAVAAASPFGTPAAGSPSHLAALRLQDLVGQSLNLIVFPSAAAARQAVVAGNVTAAMLSLGDAIGALRDGRMTGLGIAADQQAAAFPQLRPLREAGLPLTAAILRGIAAPAALAAADADRIAAALRAVAADPEFRAQADASGFEVIWLDSLIWSARAASERNDLVQLWQRAPWRRGGTG